VPRAPSAPAPTPLGEDPAERRRERLAEAIRQVRAAAGSDAVLRVLDVDPGSRVPERWAALAPYNNRGAER
jgi:protein ImuB